MANADLGRVVVAVADPMLRKVAAAELVNDGAAPIVIGFGYAHSLALLLNVRGIVALVVDAARWDGDVGGAALDNLDLLREAKRLRPAVARALIVPLVTDLVGLRDGHAGALCWAPWEPGQLLAAVRRARG